ncbi:glycoside hydrolase clan GH-D [Kribbella flavida DSM 17836]|uniref:Alpha-galactosidase n=1 Tax=Kribbella flavida (strain DSM 17836 / JCM 10339 / NBRC 14399) TaxID=479435 RepID=D2PQV4_KRIFD|nr:alpha-galactosidase [Kribbella flavida]ADB31087.1 glycoside hydrolase clan GH-D [Kribbella flavida DSM 17836]
MTDSTGAAPVRPVVLAAGRVSVVVDVSAAVPRVLHWGRRVTTAPADEAFLGTLAELQSGADGLHGAGAPSILPEQSGGWMGLPGLEGHRNGTTFSSRFGPAGWELTGAPGEQQTLVAHAVDHDARLTLTTTIELLPSGLVRLRAELANADEDRPYTVDAVRLALPVPAEAEELLDFTGRHLRERVPQRHPFTAGTHVREGRRGRTGSDSSLVVAAGTASFGFNRGEVWAVHTAWSGNHTTFAELGLAGVRTLGGGELLLPGEIVLAPGEKYTTPWVYGAYGAGLDEVAAAFHQTLRSRRTHPSSPRPVVLNTWEAVYFDHDLESLVDLAQYGAKVGAERFVLDDGWFRHRRHDRAGLGDWQVDPEVWPDGLAPLIDAVRGLGMDFGLWFEPEMVNEDSDLARSHPDWILAPGDRLPLRGRYQQVLNLTVPAAYEYILESISSLVSEHHIDYLKWDHNRDLAEAGDRATGAPRVHAQTAAVYRMLDELRRRHPWLEIESCSSGGGRVDLGILQHTDRVWASDCIDALERQQIQRWTGLVLPPELVGAHVGAPTAHTTHRTHSLAFRAATALFGHFGIEWDLRTATAAELDELAAWVNLYKSERGLIHSGTAVHSDYPDDAYWAHGYVSQAQDRALFAFVALSTTNQVRPGRIRIPGLKPETSYRVEPIELSAAALVPTAAGAPSWWTEPVTVTGHLLAEIGLQAPMLYPEQALLFRLVAVDNNPTTENRI